MMNGTLGLGIGWRPEIALAIERRSDLGFVEITAENHSSQRLAAPLKLLLEQGIKIIPHGISLSLGGAERPAQARLKHLRDLAQLCGSPLLSEHIAFVRSGEAEAGHLLPLPRTRQSLEVVVENVKIAMDVLQLPLALENISCLFEWPGAEMDEVSFISEVLDRTGAMLLLDLSNVHANAKNLGWDAMRFLTALPLARLAYVHVGGGHEADGIYHDTHAGGIPSEAIALLKQLSTCSRVPGAMLERDDNFPPEMELNAELDSIRAAMNHAG